MDHPTTSSDNLFDFDFSEIIHNLLSSLNNEGETTNILLQLKNLQDKVVVAKQRIDKVDYIRTSKEYQQKHLDCLLKQLKIKEDIIKKYQNFSTNSQLVKTLSVLFCFCYIIRYSRLGFKIYKFMVFYGQKSFLFNNVHLNFIAIQFTVGWQVAIDYSCD